VARVSDFTSLCNLRCARHTSHFTTRKEMGIRVVHLTCWLKKQKKAKHVQPLQIHATRSSRSMRPAAPDHDHAMAGLLDLPWRQVLDEDVNDEVGTVETDALVLAARSLCCPATRTWLLLLLEKRRRIELR
jgi:hypothetical protein